MLLAAGADPNDGLDDPDPDDPLGGPPWGNESLYHAAEFADPTCAELLMDAGAHPLRISYCLRRALDFENPATVSAFLRHGADPNLTVPWGGGRPALASAIASRRSPDIVKLLVDAGADLEGTGHDGVTPYQLAVRSGDAIVAEPLFQAGADSGRATPEDQSMGSIVAGRGGSTSDTVPHPDLLCHAARSGNVEVIRRLLKAGAAIDAVDTIEGITALHLAAWNGRAAAVRILLDAGADIHLRNPHGGDALGTTTHGSTESPGADERAEDYASIVEMLIATGAQLS